MVFHFWDWVLACRTVFRRGGKFCLIEVPVRVYVQLQSVLGVFTGRFCMF